MAPICTCTCEDVQTLRNKNMNVIRARLESLEKKRIQRQEENDKTLQESIKKLKNLHSQKSSSIDYEYEQHEARLKGLLNLERYQLGVLEHIGTDELLELYISFERDAHCIRGTSPFMTSGRNLKTNSEMKILDGDSSLLLQAKSMVKRYKERGNILPRLRFRGNPEPKAIQESKDALKLNNWRHSMISGASSLDLDKLKHFLDTHMSEWRDNNSVNIKQKWNLSGISNQTKESKSIILKRKPHSCKVLSNGNGKPLSGLRNDSTNKKKGPQSYEKNNVRMEGFHGKTLLLQKKQENKSFSLNQHCDIDSDMLDLRRVLTKFSSVSALPIYCDSNSKWPNATANSEMREQDLNPSNSSPSRKSIVTGFVDGDTFTPIKPFLYFNETWKRNVFEYAMLPRKPTQYSSSILGYIVGFRLKDSLESFIRFLEVWNNVIFKRNIIIALRCQHRVDELKAIARAQRCFETILKHVFPQTQQRAKFHRLRISSRRSQSR